MADYLTHSISLNLRNMWYQQENDSTGWPLTGLQTEITARLFQFLMTILRSGIQKAGRAIFTCCGALLGRTYAVRLSVIKVASTGYLTMAFEHESSIP